jgi:hypothetical protein
LFGHDPVVFVCGNVQSIAPVRGSLKTGDWRILLNFQSGRATHTEGNLMNSIIYIVGLIVIVLFILGFFGLR